MAEKEIAGNGDAASAVLAAGIGSLALGVVTGLSEIAGSLRPLLAFHRAVGPLSGRTMLAVFIWLGTWIFLHASWKNRDLDFSRIFFWTLMFIAGGLIGTFPPPLEGLGNLLRCLWSHQAK